MERLWKCRAIIGEEHEAIKRKCNALMSAHRALRLSAYRLVEKSILTFGGEILRLAASSLFKEIMEDMSLHNSVSREVHVTQQTSKVFQPCRTITGEDTQWSVQKRKLETVENKTNVEPADTWDLRRTALGGKSRTELHYIEVIVPISSSRSA